MSYRNLYFAVLLAACVGGTVQAQNRILLSQYMYNGLVLNPAYAGSQQQFSVAASYRRQWVNVDGSPAFGLLTVHTPLFQNRVGVGMQVYTENIGVHSEWSAYVQAAYKINLGVGYLSLGISGGLSRINSDYSQVNVVDESDADFGQQVTATSPNFGLGVYFYNSRWYAGISVPYLLNQRRLNFPDAQRERILVDSRSYYLTSGVIIGREGAPVQFLPSVLVRIRDFSSVSADVNLNVILFSRVLLGGSYRFNSGVVLLSQLILNDNFRVMYSYDFNFTNLGTHATGTHEIMLNYRILIPSLIKDKHCSAYF